jgi:ribose transport system substrate-binding protein
MKKLVSILLAALLVAVMIAPMAMAETKQITVGMSIPQMANPYFVSVMNGVQKKCDELGYKLIPVDAGYDVAKQVSDFENFGNQGVDCVIACPLTPTRWSRWWTG